jgi:voltage-gated potassium channel
MRERLDSLRRAAYAAAAFVVVVVAGTVGFVFVDGESFPEALYRTLITISTAGLVVVPESAGAKAITAVLVVLGVAIFLYVFGLVIELIVSGTLSGAWQERRIRRRVEQLEGHYVVCGYGRMGRSVASEFRAAGAKYVVIDIDPSVVAAATEDGHLALEGSAARDEVLDAAGIRSAVGLVAAAGSDADNLYVVVNAREHRPDLLIVARASDEDAARNLRRGGANKTISPFSIAGKEMATMVLRPQVAAFLDVFTAAGGPSFRLEQIEVSATCRGSGRTLGELNIRERTGAVVIAHKSQDGEFNTKPGPDTLFEEGDVLIGVGTADEIRALEELFAG